MIRASMIGLGLLVVLGLGGPASAQVTKYAVVDLGTLGGGTANDVNNPSQGVGTTVNDDGASHAFTGRVKVDLTQTDLGTLGGANCPFCNSFGRAINDGFQMVGRSDTGNGTTDAFLFTTASGMQDLGTLGGSNSDAEGLNFSEATGKATQIVGSSFVLGDTAEHAVTWDANLNILDLGTLGGINSGAFGDNFGQQVVGTSDTDIEDPATGLFETHAFVWDSVHGMQDLGSLGGDLAQANGINYSGQIVGFSYLAGNSQADAFLYANGTMKDLGNLGGSYSQANAINNPGTVVGFSNTTGDADVHAFVWTPKGGLQDLNNLIPANSGWDLNAANSINNNGKIVGTGILNGESHGFALIPVH